MDLEGMGVKDDTAGGGEEGGGRGAGRGEVQRSTKEEQIATVLVNLTRLSV